MSSNLMDTKNLTFDSKCNNFVADFAENSPEASIRAPATPIGCRVSFIDNSNLIRAFVSDTSKISNDSV